MSLSSFPDKANPWGLGQAAELETELGHPKAKAMDDDLSSSLYKAIWRTLDGTTPTSPVRSPVVADWKVVGSPSGTSQKLVDPMEQLLEDEARLRDGSGTLSGIASVDRARRLRSASVIGELLHLGGSEYSLFQSAGGSPVNSEGTGRLLFFLIIYC